ncbi:MAG TPA: putative Ig domain-containing protein, partial [Rhodocyclaceae bacterium]
TLTWLLQAIDPDTGEVLHDATRGLLAAAADATNAATLKSGYVGYTVQAADTAISGATIAASARVFFDEAPPVDSAQVTSTLDAAAPVTTVAVTAKGDDAQGAPTFDVQWNAVDDASGVKSVTVYVAEDGGDFKIWQRQVDPSQTQALFTGVAGRRYEFLAVATDNAGNREAASVANAVLPDDGSRQAALDALGSNDVLTQTPELPMAQPDRSYAANALFAQATQGMPGHIAQSQTADLSTVLAPFALRGFADGFKASAADIGALAMAQLADGSVLVSAGSQRNEVFRYGKDGGHGTTPLFTLDQPVVDMAVDSVGQLWVMTGAELLQVDAESGAILRRMAGPTGDPLTHALAIQPGTGDIYVSSGNGIEIFHPNETDPTRAWKHFSNQRVADLAFGPDGRLWAVRWSGSDITAAQPTGTTDIVSFPMSGRLVGRAELEYRMAGVVDSIAFGAVGTQLEGVLVASSQSHQQPEVQGVTAPAHQSAVWMIELSSRRILQVATGGTHGEAIMTTGDGRILVAESGRVDEIAPMRAPKVTAVSVPDGALVPLPLNQIAVVFDQPMWLGTETDPGSVLDAANYTLTALGDNAGATFQPDSVRWDAATRTAYLTLPSLPAGQYQLAVGSGIESAVELSLGQNYVSTFTALLDFTSQLQLDFTDTRANRADGSVSYDVSITNLGTDDLRGPLVLLLDPGRYFTDAVAGGSTGSGDQSDLWTIDLTAALQGLGGKLSAGATLAGQTVTVVPAGQFATRAGMADLVKFNLGHGVYAMPQENLPPVLTVAGADSVDADTLSAATAGQPWTGTIEAIDADGTQFFWQLVQAPAGVTLTPPSDYSSQADGYHSVATLAWTPTANALATTEIVVRVQDSRGGVATKRFQLPVTGGNHAPVVDVQQDITLAEGETLSLPLAAADADGDPLTLTVRNLPPGAVFDAATGMLTWVPGYDQAGTYGNVTVVASDGKVTASSSFSITVEQGYAKPVLAAVPVQTLREGDKYALQLAGSMPGVLTQLDGTTIRLEYSAPWLPGGATLNSETGWFEWTPDYNQHGNLSMPVTLTAFYTTPSGDEVTTSVTQNIVFNVLNANGAPVFDPAETWNILEGQPLRISVFAFDPDNPDFAPKVRLTPGGQAVGDITTAPTVSYDVAGLPPGATFDPETMEILWTPGYTQAGSYSVTVTATDDGDGTGTPAVSTITLPIVVANANQAPTIGDVSNAFLAEGATLEIPVSTTDPDGDPVQLSIIGLPSFATYTQNPSTGNGSSSGVIRFAPGARDRGDYTITVVAQDNGGDNVNQVLTSAKSFVLTVKSDSEAPVIAAPKQVAAVVGQPLSVAIQVSDMDQDALTFSADGLPVGAQLTPQTQYGQALLTWTPTADDVGSRDVEITVSDSGLPPQGAGYVNPDNPVPNVVKHTVRIVVRNANATPELLGVQANGLQVDDTGDAAKPLAINATEGTPLVLDLFAHDADADLIDWTATTLPRGMKLEVPAGASHAVLRWTPDYFAAQEGNTATPGLWRFTVKGSDGVASFERSIELTVANVNQTPRILPMPLQLVTEGDTLGFNLVAGDPDNDAVRLSMIYDDTTPAGVSFDPTSGYFEWTPGQDVVNNTSATDRAYTFTFQASDGSAVSTQTVQVRVFDANRRPRIVADSHAVVVGQTLSIPVSFGSGPGIVAIDDDGAAQTNALAVSFTGLPEGATYDAQTHLLTWTPGPGQVGDFVVAAQVFDGYNKTTQTFTLRAVADAEANAPKILISSTPSTPVVPGQLVVATVRADAWSGIGNIAVEMRGAAVGSDQWQTVALDGAGRLKLTPSAPGLIELRVTATDRDGFTATKTQALRVKDPADTSAPQLAWRGALAGATALNEPVEIGSSVDTIAAAIDERQLMNWTLSIAAAGSDDWHALAAQDYAAADVAQLLNLAELDPARFTNGVYRLRLSATDLAGRTAEIEARVIVDTATKT